MTPDIWISIAGLGVTGAGAAIAYGVLKQNVVDLKLAGEKIERRVTTCEAGHARAASEMHDLHSATSNEINALRVDVAVLTVRSETTVASLDRIERFLSDRHREPVAPRSRAAPK